MANTKTFESDGDKSLWLNVLREEFRGLKSEIVAEVLSEIQGQVAQDAQPDGSFGHWLRDELLGLKSEIVAALESEHHRLSAVGTHPDGNGDYLVMLGPCAAIVQRKKRSLENYRNHAKYPLPLPEIRGEGGQPSFYKWSEMKPWLEERFSRHLPDVPPSARYPLF